MSRLAILLMLVGCQSQPTLQPVGSTFVVTEIEGRSIESRAATTPESSSGNALPPSEQQQPRDGAARDFQTVDELRLQLGLKSMELAETRMECEELQRRVKDLKDSVDKLTAGRIAELDQRDQFDAPPAVSRIAPRPQLEAIIYTGEKAYGEGWCKNCTKLKNRWADGNAWIHITWSDEVAPADDHYPAIRFRDAAGNLRFPADEQNNYLPIDDLDRLYRTIEMHQKKPVQSIQPARQPVTRQSSSIASAPQATGATR